MISENGIECKCEHIKRDGKVCGYAWMRRTPDLPKSCPLCLARDWNSPGQRRPVTEESTEKVIEQNDNRNNDF